MRIIISFCVVLICASANCFADTTYSYIGHATLPVKVIRDTLTDSSTGYKYFLDSAQIIITAIDKKGKVVWRTDPWKDNNIRTYRVKRPVIVNFHFDKDYSNEKKEVVWIVYNNTQFGGVDKKTGTFTWYGQD
ncbi:MAG TPA: hypothetical protein VLX68_04365 [Chitinivibrionales bacterium]|nr:hypothetical protein [Chitinivibrionales bacterium]